MMRAWFGLFLLTATACGTNEEPVAAGPFAPFDTALQSYLDDNALAGATVVVVHRDKGILHINGYGNMAADRISLVASASKVVSVGVLMKLADDGLLDIDTPVSEYLGAWGEHKTNITIAQMLSNSSGMVGLFDDPSYGPYLCQFLDGGSLAECGESIYTAADDDDLVPPDTTFRYGGGQWQLAGAVAEVVSGKSWDALIEEIYVEPCGLTASGYGNHFSQALLNGGGVTGGTTSYPVFFDGDPSALLPTDNPNIEGGLHTHVEDYAKILLMHLRGGLCGDTRVLSESAVSQMQEDRIGEVYDGTSLDPGLPGYGLGWWIDRATPLVADAGAYGAIPWLDIGRGYGAMVILEFEALKGVLLRLKVQPVLEEIIDQLETQ